MKIKNRKIRGGQKSELTLLVNFCREHPEALERIVKFMNTARADKLFPTSAEMRQFIGEHHGIQLQRDSQFSSFLKWVELEETKTDRELKISDAISKYRRENPEATDAEMDVVGRRMFKEISIAEEDPKTYVAILREETRREQLGLDARKVAILEKKAAAFDQAKEVVESKLSPEEQRERLKKILA